MFCLTGATRFKYIPGYRDMCGGYEKLSSVIRSLGEEIEEGTAYVFTSRDQKLVKIIRHENCERQLYVQRFDSNVSFLRLTFEGDRPVYELKWKYLVALLSFPVIKAVGPAGVKRDGDAA